MYSLRNCYDLIDNLTNSMNSLRHVNANKPLSVVDQKIFEVRGFSATSQDSSPPISHKISDLKDQSKKILQDIKTFDWNTQENDELQSKLILLYKSFIQNKKGLSILTNKDNLNVSQEIEYNLVNIGREYIYKNSFFYFIQNLNISLDELFSLIEKTGEDRTFELAKICVEVTGPTNYILKMNDFYIPTMSKRSEIAKYCIQERGMDAVVDRLKKFNITDKDMLFELALTAIENKGGFKVFENLEKFGITEPDKLLKIALACCKSGQALAIIQNIKKFKFSSEEELLKFASLCIENGGAAVFAQYFSYFNIEDEEIRCEMAEKCIKHGGARAVAVHIEQFEIEDPQKRFEIACNCIKNGAAEEISAYTQKFDIKPHHKEIADLCIENGAAVQVAWHIQFFVIPEEENRVKIALSCILHDAAKELSYNIGAFAIVDPEKRFEIAKTCIENGETLVFIGNLQKFKIEDSVKRFELVKLAIKNGAAQGITHNLDQLGITTEEQMIEIAKLSVEYGGAHVIARQIKRFKIKSADTRLELMLGCIKKGESETVADHFRSFSIPKEKHLEVATCLLQYGGAKYLALNIEKFSIPNHEEREVIAYSCIENGGASAVATNIEHFAIEPGVALQNVMIACIMHGGATSVIRRATEFNLRTEPEVLQLFQFCLLFDKRNLALDEIHKSKLFSFKFGFPERAELTADFYNSFNFSSLQEKLLKFQNEFFKNEPFSDILNTILENKDAPIKYKNLILLSDLMILFLALPEVSVPCQKIIPCIFELGKPHLRLPIGVCAAHLMLNPERINHLNTLLDDSKYWNVLTSVLYSSLACQGVDSRFLSQQGQFRFETEKKSSIFDKKENTQALIEMLLLLSQNETLQPHEKQELLQRITNEAQNRQKSILKNIYSVIAIFNFNESERLKDSTNTLSNMSEAIFREKCPIGKVEDFPIKYAGKIAGCRNPESFIRYAAKMASLNDPSVTACFGDFVTAYLNGTFLGVRYNLDNNLHLKTLETLSPGIVEKWKESICKETSLDDLQLDANVEKIDKQSALDWMRMKLLTDQHMSLDGLEYLNGYLIGNDFSDELSKKIVKQVEINKNDKSKENKEILTKLQLQQYCIKWMKEPDIKAGQSILTEIRKRLQPNSLFFNDIEGKLAEKIESKGLDSLVIVDTDDPIEIFLCGTEISGSCQNIDAEAKLNKGLLGYLMDGKNRVIAIKNEKTGKIEARCLIRLLLDEDNKPVLFMERVYSDIKDDKTPKALTSIALRKSKSLGIPLVSLEGNGASYDQQLRALEGSAPFDYSDGSKNPIAHPRGIFAITDAKFVY